VIGAVVFYQQIGDCPDLRRNENGTVSFSAKSVTMSTQIRTARRLLSSGEAFYVCLFHIIPATGIVYAIVIAETFHTGRFKKTFLLFDRAVLREGDREIFAVETCHKMFI
jgi:hypothetical protein